MVRKKLHNYIYRRGGRRQLHARYYCHDGSYTRGTVATTTTVGHGGRVQSVFKKIIIFCLNLDGGKLYMKIVAFAEIYNFVVQSFSVIFIVK
jgi:transposase-like protein